MRALFDYQIQKDDTVRPQDAGAIIDAVFYNQDSARGVKVATGMNEILNHHWLHGQFGIFIKKPKIRNFKEMYPKLWLIIIGGIPTETTKNGIAEYGSMVSDAHWQKTTRIKSLKIKWPT